MMFAFGPLAQGSWAAAIPFAAVLLVVWMLLRRWYRQSHIAGPRLAAISNLPRLFWARSGRAHQTYMSLHAQYGDLVRVGPNAISVGDPRVLDRIYGIKSSFPKSDFYRVLQPMSKGRIIPGLFHTTDEQLHRSMKRPIAGLYSMTNVAGFEPYVDRTIEFFFRRLDAVQQQQQQKSASPINLGVWLQWFAFDVMGEITFSRRLGFLERAADVDGIMAEIWRAFEYASWVGQMPWLDKLWVKNPWLSRLVPEKSNPIVAFALARAGERKSCSGGGKNHGGSEKPTSPSSPLLSPLEEDGTTNSRDFMSRFLEARAKDPGIIPEWYVTAWATSNILAGSDTTAIVMRSVLYYLLRDQQQQQQQMQKGGGSLRKLQDELDLARAEGRLSKIATWREARRLPYLGACIKEAERLHPPIGLPLERVVPAAGGGVELCGARLRAGTIVGMNPWVVHRNRDVFGLDADEWNPDRWLGDDEGRRLLMEKSLLTFGAGHRTCIGKNISHLEIYKLIPSLLTRYSFDFANPEKEWQVTNRWMVVQKEFYVHLSHRAEAQRY